jgi:hypothetical protein
MRRAKRNGSSLVVKYDKHNPVSRSAVKRLIPSAILALAIVALSASVALAGLPEDAMGHGEQVSAVAQAVEYVSGEARGEAVSSLARTHGPLVAAAAREHAAAAAAAGMAKGAAAAEEGTAKGAAAAEEGTAKGAAAAEEGTAKGAAAAEEGTGRRP